MNILSFSLRSSVHACVCVRVHVRVRLTVGYRTEGVFCTIHGNITKHKSITAAIWVFLWFICFVFYHGAAMFEVWNIIQQERTITVIVIVRPWR